MGMDMYVERIWQASSREERIFMAVQGFVELFPFMHAGLYSYSPLNEMGEGIILITQQGVTSIRDKRADTRSLPQVQSAISNKRAEYLNSTDLSRFPKEYVNDDLSHLVIVPICYNSTVVGCGTISCFVGQDPLIGDRILSSLTQYGRLIGGILASCGEKETKGLSRREKEVIQRLSFGESIKEMADHIGISEFTVRDYIKSALRKLGAQHRAQAVAEALRRGIIH